MTDRQMIVHFKTRNRQLMPGAPAGGYAWVYGRFPDWEAFELEAVMHFRRHFRFDVIDFEDKRKVDRAPKDPVVAGLVRDLDKHPLQYHPMQFYTADQNAAH